ncbi:MAG TPA: helix-turn-helix domain-containing protein [Bacteroidales bacterium]|nr:helix-turn-helix domain-containing protein [Bacteroidales bacterium]HOK75458.1 helix-turn-helix domain-containing protein [Bacteroidales bacterium]HOM40111.1 helix-turn-helix domain-containing protein [Bacteroidales bacterium]HPP93376.1 helix-turn-helix domain-containing protein [Bacteroidales bacterium]
MITREELLKSSEYWIEIIQNKVFNDLTEYIESSKLSNKELAKLLGVSKGRISQILSGENLNFRLDTLVKICLAINRVPDFRLLDLNEYISRDIKSSYSVVFENFDVRQAHVVNLLQYEQGTQSGVLKLKNEASVFEKEIKYEEQTISTSKPQAA